MNQISTKALALMSSIWGASGKPATPSYIIGNSLGLRLIPIDENRFYNQLGDGTITDIEQYKPLYEPFNIVDTGALFYERIIYGSVDISNSNMIKFIVEDTRYSYTPGNITTSRNYAEDYKTASLPELPVGSKYRIVTMPYEFIQNIEFTALFA